MLDYAMFCEAIQALLVDGDTYKGGALSIRFEPIDNVSVIARLNPLGYPDSQNQIYHNDNVI